MIGMEEQVPQYPAHMAPRTLRRIKATATKDTTITDEAIHRDMAQGSTASKEEDHTIKARHLQGTRVTA